MRKRRIARKTNKRFKLPQIIIIVTILISLVTFYEIDRKLKPTLMTLCDTEARNAATSTINNTVREEFGSKISYDNMMDMRVDKDGNLVMIQANTVELNRIGSQISLAIQERIKDIGVRSVKIPLGVITQNDLFASYGPKISFKMKPVGSVATSYRSEFQAQGINQTRHIIYVDVTTSIQVIVPLATNSIKVTTNIPIAESIIVGKVPDTYANFNKDLQSIGKAEYGIVKEQSE
ncbi:sporulation protein YunB [Clostridium cylindrosporum]|uniref:Sporulation protein YunB n=1 Tax=Clostridium cylindrosporum DSM 605 TaxID=1121307 RepID=A0A0J8D965_CLOCY|nr:sporulation protein YunB [Clostridium cylindrosporum]KMT22570.1 sporulation protein YunB [Clostridium cylindrosporum DSM 605]